MYTILNRFLRVSLLLLITSPLLAHQYFGSRASSLVEGASHVWVKEGATLPSYIALAAGHEVAEEDVLMWIRRVYGFDNHVDISTFNEAYDAFGDLHRRVKLTHHGVPLFDGMLVLHFRNNMMYAINGDVPEGYQVINQLILDEQTALQRALDAVGATRYKWEMPEEEALLQYLSDDPTATYYPTGRVKLYRPNRNSAYKYAWVFNVYADQPLYRADLFVDAVTGEILFEHNLIHETDVTGTAVTKYSGTRSFTTDSTSTTYRLRQAGRGNGIETYNMQRGTSYGAAVDFTDSDNYWNNFNANLDEVATDAHWGTEVTYDYFYTRGLKLLSYVHYDNNYVNAFWDGQRMTYGDGNGSSITPLTALDIVGHEITHGLTSYTAALIYQNESGALNEGFSDIFGTSIEWFARPNNANWTVGEDIGTIIRSMSNPKSRGLPDTYLGQNWYTGTANNGGVHTNNGPLSYWYYLLSEGGTGTNDNSDSYNVTGISIDSAGPIAFRMLAFYLPNSSQYVDARFYAIQSAIDLYGPCSQAVESTTNAMYAVGVGPPYVPGVISDFEAPQTLFCAAPATVSFTNLSNNGITYHWDFGNGQTSTDVNPTVTYTAPGNYTVTLVVSGGACGTDTLVKTDLISIDPQHPCNYNMPQQGSVTSYECSGFLYDSGGPQNYQNNTNGVFVIAPPNAMSVTLTFQSFDFEEGYDYLHIYDGDNIQAPLIGRYDGSNLPNGGVITSTTGSITLRQTSDQGVTEPGFFLGWSCQYPTAAPVADFIVSDTLTCSGEVSFLDISTNGPNQWLWDFGDGNTSVDRIVTHTYAQSGVYNVSLTTSNIVGSHSITKYGLVRVNMPFPKVVNGAVCNSGVVTLSNPDTTTITRWFDSPGAAAPFHTGSTFTTPTLTQSTTYWVEEVIERTPHTGAKLNNSGGGSFFTAAVKHHLVFDVHKSSLLQSVVVYAGASGNRTIELQNSNGNVLRSVTVPLTQGANVVDLNFELVPGIDYRLVGPASPNLYRNNGGINYPYHIEGLLSVKYSSATSNPTGFYYYFYQWKVSELPCVSDRVPVTAHVNDQPPVAAFNFTQMDPVVNFSDQTSQPGVNNWDFGDGTTGFGSNPIHLYKSLGTFNVHLTVDNGCGTDQTTQQVTISSLEIETNSTNNALVVYPVPSDGVFSVRVTDMDLPKTPQFVLHDVAGRSVDFRVYRYSSDTYTISLNRPAPGIYLVTLTEGEQIYRAKVMVK